VLANELKKSGTKIHFIGQFSEKISIDRNIVDSIKYLDENGKQDADQVIEYADKTAANIIILDNYAVDEQYQQCLFKAGCRWLQFSGKPDQRYWANWVLSLSPATRRTDYEHLVQQPDTRLLLGPEYAILDPRFVSSKENVNINDMPRKLTLTFGGGDDRGAILFCLNALQEQSTGIEFNILVGSGNPNVASIDKWISGSGRSNIYLHVDNSHWMDIMAMSDLAITAGGMTTFEMAFLGIPTIIIQIADNQKRNAEAWDRLGVAINLGNLHDLKEEKLKNAVTILVGDQKTRHSMHICGRKVVDGRGVTRIVNELLDR